MQNIFTIKNNRLYKKHIILHLQYLIEPKRKNLIYIIASIYGIFQAVHINNKHSLISDYDNMNKRAIQRYRKDNIKYCSCFYASSFFNNDSTSPNPFV